jgi:heme A synthase
MKQLLRLALAADLAALMTVVLGSWTRINGAGLTCPDWPLCRGRLLPSLTDGTLWEWTHRLLAFAVAPLVIALIIAAWRKRDRSSFIGPTLAAIAALFLVQVFLGAETVRHANTPISVVLHWATAMALIAALSAMVVFAAVAVDDEADNASRAPSRAVLSLSKDDKLRIAAVIVVGATAVVAFVTMCVGAYVSSSGAGLACLSIPQCAGNVVIYTPEQYVQMVHRIAAAATLICAASTLALVWARPASARVRAAVGLGVGLVCIQVLLGLLNVALRLPTNLREAHAVNAALVFLTFFVATIFAALDAAPAGELRRLTEGGSQR